jgi:hypothetical protein
VDPVWLARQLAASARDAAADPRVEEWFRARVVDARARVPSGPPVVPHEIRGPLRDVLARPYVPDREILGRILDHDAARLLLRNLFQDVLVAFARRIRPTMPGQGKPLPVFKGLHRLGGNMLAAAGHELEQQVEHRAREFMDAGVQRLVEKLADELCNPRLVNEYGEWRAHAMDVLLATDLTRLAAEVEKLDPEALVATGAALVRGIAGREELVGQLEQVLRAALDASENRSVRELLGGLEVHGIGMIRDVMRQRARAVVETDAFAAWWEEIVEGPPR